MYRISAAFLFTFCLFMSSHASAAMVTCRLTYSLKGWSFIYKNYRGHGTIRCENGQSASVIIATHAGGLTAGKSEIDSGKGRFSEVKNIQETYGTYVVLGAHAGATKSAEGQVLTKGEVSLSISGKGRGFDLGITLGAFTIKPGT